MILLSFDIEEFDMPFEYERTISFDDQMAISIEGTEEILRILALNNIKATFFCTATFAINAPLLVRRIVDEGHELASHGYFHSSFEAADLLKSKKVLEVLAGCPVNGFRMARMMPVDENEVREAGYHYNSSINPTYLPGRYNNLKKPRTFFREKGVIQLPASVTPNLRIPLFWLSFHNFPLGLYSRFCSQTYRHDGYLNIYFHPWEFIDLDDKERFGFPGYVSKNTGRQMSQRLERLIEGFKKNERPFGTITQFLTSRKMMELSAV